jgi:hypothetical protein
MTSVATVTVWVDEVDDVDALVEFTTPFPRPDA